MLSITKVYKINIPIILFALCFFFVQYKAEGAPSELLSYITSFPDFNPNNYFEYNIENFKNRVISDSYEPGSTFKIVALSAILDLEIYDDADKFYCEQGETTLINKKKLRDHEPYEYLNISEIFTYSSNIGMSKIVDNLNSKDFYKYCK